MVPAAGITGRFRASAPIVDGKAHPLLLVAEIVPARVMARANVRFRLKREGQGRLGLRLAVEVRQLGPSPQRRVATAGHIDSEIHNEAAFPDAGHTKS
jgi:hypothetical protein